MRDGAKFTPQQSHHYELGTNNQWGTNNQRREITSKYGTNIKSGGQTSKMGAYHKK